MEMYYDGTLVMPKNYSVMDEEEMTYVEGGGTIKIKIGKNSFIIGALAAVGGTLTTAKCIAVLGGLGVSIAAAIELGTAGLGTLYAGAFLLSWGTVASAIAGYAVTYGVNSLKGKTFTVCSAKFLPSKTFTI